MIAEGPVPHNVIEQYLTDPPCEKCGTEPAFGWTFDDLDWWIAGQCPTCNHSLLGDDDYFPPKPPKKGKVTHLGLTVDNGTSATGGATTTDTWWKKCEHKGDKVPIAPGVTLYAYGGLAQKTLPDVDYMIALDSGWLADGDAFYTAPGVLFAPPSLTQTAVKYLYLVTPDRGVPRNVLLLADLAQWAVAQARAGKKVGVGCVGGHGRTGLFLSAALLAAKTNKTGDEAVLHLRDIYCKEAVESYEQIDLLNALALFVWSDKAVSDQLETRALIAGYMEEKKKTHPVTTYIYNTKSLNTGPLPKKIKVRPVHELQGATATPALQRLADQEVAPEEWGMQKGDIVVYIPGEPNMVFTLYPKEYEVLEPGDEPLKALGSGKPNVGPPPRRVRIKPTAFQALQPYVGKTLGVEKWGTLAGCVVVKAPDGKRLDVYASEYTVVEGPKTQNLGSDE